eukprot:TRINITY_DN22267_c0_g1_i1.p3 TRINITY_DN22267_c0_g1~~TRINITY_DN22267_c0_g1_i1.p3  ORF type:complete len:132 (+),score=46.57 TRINITY_DN22267_c0_g1_i1:82-477(+)
MARAAALLLAAALLVFGLPTAEARLSDHWTVIRKKCPKEQCGNEDFPILDWDEKEGGRCLCKPHPCHNDNGKKHLCKDPKFPFLAFSYDQDGELACVCKPNPCPEEKCDEGSKISWDHNGKCMCIKSSGEL